MISQGAEDIQMYKSKTRMIQSSLGSAWLKEKKNSGKNIHLLSLSQSKRERRLENKRSCVFKVLIQNFSL